MAEAGPAQPVQGRDYVFSITFSEAVEEGVRNDISTLLSINKVFPLASYSQSGFKKPCFADLVHKVIAFEFRDVSLQLPGAMIYAYLQDSVFDAVRKHFSELQKKQELAYPVPNFTVNVITNVKHIVGENQNYHLAIGPNNDWIAMFPRPYFKERGTTNVLFQDLVEESLIFRTADDAAKGYSVICTLECYDEDFMLLLSTMGRASVRASFLRLIRAALARDYATVFDINIGVAYAEDSSVRLSIHFKDESLRMYFSDPNYSLRIPFDGKGQIHVRVIPDTDELKTLQFSYEEEYTVSPMDIDPVMNSPVCVLENLRAFRDDERAAISVALNAYCSSDSEEGPKIDLVVVTGLAGKPFSEYERVGEWLICNEEIAACQPPRFYVKYATEFRPDADSVALVPLSCASGTHHGAAVAKLTTIVGAWCDAHPRAFSYTTDAKITIGNGQRAPDVAIRPASQAAVNRYPRLIIEFEHNNRTIRELRLLVHEYFAADHDNCLRAVLAIKVTDVHASAVLYRRNAANVVYVAGHYDFGREPCTASQLNDWSYVAAANAPPAPNVIDRYDAHAQWPQQQDDPNWQPGPPIVTIPSGQITHNLNAATAALLANGLVNLTIDLGFVLQAWTLADEV